MEHYFSLSFLFYFISAAFSPLLSPKQNAAEPYVERSHDVDFTHENKIVHYFYCIGDASASKGWTIMYLIGGDGVGIFFSARICFRG